MSITSLSKSVRCSTCRLDIVGDANDGAERGVQQQATDGTLFIIVVNTSRSRHITTTALNFQAHADLSICTSQVADYVLRVYDLDFITVSDITSGNGACSRLGRGQSYLVLAFQLHSDTFQVEQDFKNVFLYTFFAAVLVQYSVDLDFSNRTTGHR